MLVQPATEHHVLRQRPRLGRQRHEHGLGHVLSRLRIPADQPEGGRIDQVEVAADEFPEGGFRAGPRVS